MHHGLYILSVVIHLLAAVTWIGGMLFLVLVVVPSARRLPPDTAVALIRDSGRRFRVVGWICLALLAATGTTNLLLRGIPPALWIDPVFWSGPFGQTLAWKLLLVGAIWALSAVHDFWIGPQASERLRAAPRDPAALRFRALASWLGRLNLLLSLAVLALGVMLVRGRPW